MNSFSWFFLVVLFSPHQDASSPLLQCHSIAESYQGDSSAIKTRAPATYIPRAEEFRQDLRSFERRILGYRQDALDFLEFRKEVQTALRDFRRLYPEAPPPQEIELRALAQALDLMFSFFQNNPYPQQNQCLELMQQVSLKAEIKDGALLIRIIARLCQL